MTRNIEPHLTITDEGIVLGQTLLAKFRGSELHIRETRILTLLAVAYETVTPATIIRKFRTAAEYYASGNIVLAQMTLALTGLPALQRKEQVQKLRAAEAALATHRNALPLLKHCGIEEILDDPNALYLYKLAGGKRFHKFTDAEITSIAEDGLLLDEELGEGDDDYGFSDEDGTDSSIGGNGDFESKHPRWPAGSADSAGGEFAPKDGGGQATASTSSDSWYEQNKDWVKPVVIGAAVVGGVALAIGTGGAAVPEELAIATTLAEGAEVGATTAAIGTEAAIGEGVISATSAEWQLGAFKSSQRWANQMTNRSWKPEQIGDVIARGERFSAPNFVNKGNTATRYLNPDTGRFVVKDDITNEILQISREGFIPNE